MSAGGGPPRPAYLMRGPSALAGDPRRFFTLAITLALTDFKLRFFGSALGYVWSLVRPLMLFGVLYLVFSRVLRLGAGVAHYPLVLLSGIVLYTFFAEATSAAVISVLTRENLVRKVQLPRLAVPLSVCLEASFGLALNLVAVFVFIGLSGVAPRLSWLELPVLLVLLVVFATGVGTLLSALYVPLRDVAQIWSVVLQVLFYATPVIYPLEKVAEKNAGLSELLMCNPLAAVIEQVRHAVLDPSAPSAATAIGGSVRLLVPLGIGIVFVVLGVAVFNRAAPRIAEEL